MTIATVRAMGKKLANNACIHGRTNETNINSALVVMNHHLKNHIGRQFNGVVTDTASNKRSLMSNQKYHAYEREFGRNIIIQPQNKGLKGIGGKTRIIGEVTVQIHFNELCLTIDLNFSITEADAPSLLHNRDMMIYGLEISLQGISATSGREDSPLPWKITSSGIGGQPNPFRSHTIRSNNYDGSTEVLVIHR